MNAIKKPLLVALGCAAFAFLWCCDKTTAGGSDEIDTRVAVDPSGKPVASARIVLVRSGDSTQTAQAVTTTGTDGAFPELRVPDGWYSLVVHSPSDSLGKFVDSLRVVSNKLPAGRDTLRAVGRIRGVVKLLGGDPPSTVVVGLVGTDILANAKADGSFSVELVPGGTYTLGAISSVEGYGPLYLRLRLREGQDTLLADTLKLPYSGLPLPSEFQVIEDTGNGNVRLSWSGVAHPDLMGYVVERVESGSTTNSQYLTDTVWVDSLRNYWESQPLLGPWPARNLVYRVRSRSLSGAPDSKSVAQNFRAVAPNWTARMDSVRVTRTTDTVTGVSTLRWNTPVHPDVVGWRVVRTPANTASCSSASLSIGQWKDSACGDPRLDVVATTTDSGKSFFLYRPESPLVSFIVQAVRRNGASEIVGTASWQSNSSLHLVNWKDSTAGITSSTTFESFGGWLLWSEAGRNSKVSRDGSNWEEIPDQADGVRWKVTGQGDSLWMAKLTEDSRHVVVSSRIGSGIWAQKVYRMEDSVDLLGPVAVDSGRLAIVCGSSFQLYRTSLGDSLVPVPGATVLRSGYSTSWSNLATLPDSGWLISFSSVYGEVGATVYQGDGVRSRTRKLRWGSSSGILVTSFRTPIGNQGGYLFDYLNIPAYFTPSSNAWILPTPSGSETWNPQTATVFRDEIWAVIDGHLWKGRLNLPPS